jgi:23S rRNA maturation-related 3'-5' exoribonuclease YhaM
VSDGLDALDVLENNEIHVIILDTLKWYGELVTKLKSKILNHHKLWTILQKSVLIIFILIIVVSFAVLDSLKNLHYSNNELHSIQKSLSDTQTQKFIIIKI